MRAGASAPPASFAPANATRRSRDGGGRPRGLRCPFPRRPARQVEEVGEGDVLMIAVAAGRHLVGRSMPAASSQARKTRLPARAIAGRSFATGSSRRRSAFRQEKVSSTCPIRRAGGWGLPMSTIPTYRGARPHCTAIDHGAPPGRVPRTWGCVAAPYRGVSRNGDPHLHSLITPWRLRGSVATGAGARHRAAEELPGVIAWYAGPSPSSVADGNQRACRPTCRPAGTPDPHATDTGNLRHCLATARVWREETTVA